MIAAPLFHSWGFFHFVISLPTASTMVLRRRFDPEETLRAVQDHRADVLAAVPVMVQRILRLPDETLVRYDLSSLRITSLSGSALPGELALEWMDRFGDTSTTSTARPRSPTRPSPPRPTCGRPRAPRGARRGAPSCGSRRRRAGGARGARSGGSSSATTCPFEGYTGGGGKEAIDGLLSQRRRRPLRRRRPPLHRRPRRRDDRLRRRERLPARGRGPARRPRGGRRGGGDRGRGRGVRPAAQGLRRAQRRGPSSPKPS